MNKREIFYKYTDFELIRGIGSGFLSRAKGYIPIGSWLQDASVWQIALWGIGNKIDFWFIHFDLHWLNYGIIMLIFIVRFYFMIFGNWALGKLFIKIGLYDAELQYSAKKQHLNPVSVQMLKTLKSICEKIGAKSHITEL